MKWRPPADDADGHQDRHEPMLAVATAPVKGASAGGAGLLALWSWKRPFMPLSVVVGHRDGAATDFHWLDVPTREKAQTKSKTASAGSLRGTDSGTDLSSRRGSRRVRNEPDSPFRGASRSYHGEDSFPTVNLENTKEEMGIWQHLLSVGRDGRCLIQSLARGAFKYGLFEICFWVLSD